MQIFGFCCSSFPFAYFVFMHFGSDLIATEHFYLGPPFEDQLMLWTFTHRHSRIRFHGRSIVKFVRESIIVCSAHHRIERERENGSIAIRKINCNLLAIIAHPFAFRIKSRQFNDFIDKNIREWVRAGPTLLVCVWYAKSLVVGVVCHRRRHRVAFPFRSRSADRLALRLLSRWCRRSIQLQKWSTIKSWPRHKHLIAISRSLPLCLYGNCRNSSYIGGERLRRIFFFRRRLYKSKCENNGRQAIQAIGRVAANAKHPFGFESHFTDCTKSNAFQRRLSLSQHITCVRKCVCVCVSVWAECAPRIRNEAKRIENEIAAYITHRMREIDVDEKYF